MDAKDVREWYAFHGGEELGITLEQASIVWDAALMSIKECDVPQKSRGCTATHLKLDSSPFQDRIINKGDLK